MKFTVDSLEFLTVAKTISKGLINSDNKTQATFNLKEDKLTMVASSGTTLFKGVVRVKDVELGSNIVALDYEQFKVISEILPQLNVDVVFELKDSYFLIKVLQDEYKLSTLNSIIPVKKEELNKLAEIDALDFTKTMATLAKGVASDPSLQERPISCLHLELNGDKASFMATDNVSLSEVIIKVDPKSENLNEMILIKNNQISLLNRAFNPSDTLTLVSTDTKFGYIDNKGVLALVGKVDLNPMIYRPLLKKASQENFVVINSDKFKSVVSALSKLDNTSSNLKFNFLKGKLTLSNNRNDKSDVFVDEYKCEDTTLIIPRQAINVTSGLYTKNIMLFWGPEDNRPFVKVQLLDNEMTPLEHTTIILPLIPGKN